MLYFKSVLIRCKAEYPGGISWKAELSVRNRRFANHNSVIMMG